MFITVLILFSLFSKISSEIPCEKLKIFGDNVRNKAGLAPIIIKGKPGMKIDLPNDVYKVTVDIISVIKGSLGNWQSSVIIVGEFSVFKKSIDSCKFQSDANSEQIYFLQVTSEGNGEYKVIFNPEIVNSNILKEIEAIICKGCGKSPMITVTDLSTSNDLKVLNCVSHGNPIPILSWDIPKASFNRKLIPIKNGIRLIEPVSDSANYIYICRAVNIIGSSSYAVVFKNEVSLRKLIETQTSRLALKYIIIGSIIVLAGCIFIILVIICLWKWYSSRYLNKETQEKEDEEEEISENNRPNSKNLWEPLSTNESNSLVITNIQPHVSPNKIKPPYYDTDQNFKVNETNNFSSGNGIYEGINILS